MLCPIQQSGGLLTLLNATVQQHLIQCTPYPFRPSSACKNAFQVLQDPRWRRPKETLRQRRSPVSSNLQQYQCRLMGYHRVPRKAERLLMSLHKVRKDIQKYAIRAYQICCLSGVPAKPHGPQKSQLTSYLNALS